MDYHNIIIKPLFTEKMSILQETQRKYAFQVSQFANKIEIKKAIQKRFDVEVEKVVPFEAALHAHVRANAVELMDKINSTGGFDEDIQTGLKTLLDEFKATGAY